MVSPKTTLASFAALAILLTGAGCSSQATIDATTQPQDNARIAAPATGTPAQPEGKLKVGNFTGKLEQVNTGCFADGECYVVVDKKHVTVLMGWSRDTVGSIQGAESIGDLEKFIGKDVEVYAKDKGDGTYTLYGSEGFYVKVK